MSDLKIEELIPGSILIVDKPKGITSHDVIDQVRNKYGTMSVGHAGTLDPFATGELIVLLNEYTKYSNTFLTLKKSYIFEAILGKKTLSGDLEDKVIAENTDVKFDKEIFESKIKEQLEKYLREYYQVVPILSSIKVAGYKLRELTRNSSNPKAVKRKELDISDNEILVQTDSKERITTESDIGVFDLKRGVKYILLPKRKVDIVSYKDIKVERNEDGVITMSGEIDVSSGTYIRKLVEDITENSLNIYSYLSSLSRKYDRDSILKAISSIKT
jgi:tRNA pseudouridine(55) synthase